MKTFAFVIAICAGAFLTNAASAAEKTGTIPSGMLAQMGLAGLQQVSDEEGMQVRGKGFRGHGHHHHGHHGHHGHHHHGHKHKHKHK